MIEYKGYKIPDNYDEIMKINKEANRPGVMLPKIQYIDKDKMFCPLSTISLEEFDTSTVDASGKNGFVNDYIDIVKEYIDARIKHIETIEEENNGSN